MKDDGFTLTEILITLVGILGIIGWVMNIVKIVETELVPMTTIFVIRVVGIFVPPLGAVLGYI